jgi:hypothetical protein
MVDFVPPPLPHDNVISQVMPICGSLETSFSQTSLPKHVHYLPLTKSGLVSGTDRSVQQLSYWLGSQGIVVRVPP